MRTSTLTRQRLAKHTARQPAAGPETTRTKVLSAYLRLSVDRDGNKVGYEVQKAAIQRWAADNGYTIGRWYQDKDITAADLKAHRPEYEQMLADSAAGMWDGIVVWRLDRLVRLTREFARICSITEEAGVFITALSGEQQVDTRTAWGSFIMWLLVLLADMEIKTMKARNKAHQNWKAEHGKYKGGGPRPFGFVGAKKDKEGRILNSGKVGIEHVKAEIELLREAARRIAWEGWEWTEVIREWNSRTPPVRGATGAPWSVFALQRCLTGPRAVGRREFVVEDPETGEAEAKVVKAEWEPVLDERTWDMLNSMLVPMLERGPHETYLLSGLLLCGRCGRPLTGARRKYVKGGVMSATTTYRCKSGVGDKEKGACGKLSVLAEPTEKLVIARILERIAATPDTADTLSEPSQSLSDRIARATDTLEECDAKLRELAHMWGSGGTTDAWLTAKAVVEERRAAALATLESTSKTARLPTPSKTDRQNLLNWFGNGLTLAQQRKLVEFHVLEVRASATGRSGPHFNPERIQIRLAGAK